MSSQLLTSNRRRRTSWMLTAGLIALLLAAGVWLILERFAARDSSHVEPVTVAEQHERIDQPRTASPEPDNGQDGSESSRTDSDAESDRTASPEPDNGQDGSESSRTDSDADSDLIATRTPPQVDLGLEDIVREYILELWGGGLRAEDDYVPSTYAKLESADPETRRRGDFELLVGAQFALRLADDPYYPLLRESRHDGWWSCLEEYGVPPLEEFGLLTLQQQDAMIEELGLVGERAEQLQAECWSRARIYAGKDEETDRLLLSQHQYYLKIAQDWVKQDPDSAVPLP